MNPTPRTLSLVLLILVTVGVLGYVPNSHEPADTFLFEPPVFQIPPPATAPVHAVPPPPTLTSIDAPAAVTRTATRGTAVQIGTTTIPQPVGLHGLPFAPEGLSACDDMMWYATQFGLPERFRGIGFRESSCRNNVTSPTGCCHGFWQLYVTLHLRDHTLAPLYADCEVVGVASIKGNDPITKQRQACAAATLYRLNGTDPWRATR